MFTIALPVLYKIYFGIKIQIRFYKTMNNNFDCYRFELKNIAFQDLSQTSNLNDMHLEHWNK